MNINEKNTIYYGTDIKHIEELDSVGLMKPRHREEQYLSVSISGFESIVEIKHPDLLEMGRVYAEEMNICTIRDNKFCFNDGYENTLTYIEGFGPNSSKYLKGFYGLVENTRTKNTVTVVLSKEANKYLVKPDKCREFEYLSLALHGFIECIKPEMIVGWIIPECRYREVMYLMDKCKIRKLKLWKDTEFKAIDYDVANRVKYGLFPRDIDMYLSNISKNEYYAKTRFKHLKSILQEFNNINWESGISGIEDELKSWLSKYRNKIKWNEEKLRYQYD